MVQNAAAGLLIGTCKYEHISPIRQASSLSLFQSSLKTYIFSLAFDTWCWYLCIYFLFLWSLNVVLIVFYVLHELLFCIELWSSSVFLKCFINKVCLIDWLIVQMETFTKKNSFWCSVWQFSSVQFSSVDIRSAKCAEYLFSISLIG